MEHLEGALSSCKEELKAILEQSERNRKRFTDDAVKQREKVSPLSRYYFTKFDRKAAILIDGASIDASRI